MSSTTKLLPCPFCSNADISIKNENPKDNSGGYFIECPGCGASTALRFARGDDPTHLLAEQWNRRTASNRLHQIQEPEADIWPCVNIDVDASGKITNAKLYSPGLPAGNHDVYPVRVPYMDEHTEAWRACVDELEKAVPGFMSLGNMNGIECAVAAIRELAVRAKHQEPAAAEQAVWNAGLDEGRAQATGSVSNATSQAAPAAVAVPERWRPDVCPITRRRFFGWIEHWKTGQKVPTYGGPFDSYTIPVKDEEGTFSCERFDHDAGEWMTEGMGWCCLGLMLTDDQAFVVQPDNPRYDEIRDFAEGRAALAATPATVEVPAEGDPESLHQLATLIESGRHLIQVERKEIANALRILAATPAATAQPATLGDFIEHFDSSEAFRRQLQTRNHIAALEAHLTVLEKENKELREAAAAPVVLPEPVAVVTFEWRKKPDVKWLIDTVVRGTKLYTEPQLRALLAGVSAPASLGPALYSIDADPEGIRSRVVDAITGALAFGAQKSGMPPAGHWLMPFWMQARFGVAQYEALRDATDALLEAPAADALDDTALLDAMERQRIAVAPEYEGPWDAEVYNGDEKPNHRGSGSTPREAIRAAIAAAKGGDGAPQQRRN